MTYSPPGPLPPTSIGPDSSPSSLQPPSLLPWGLTWTNPYPSKPLSTDLPDLQWQIKVFQWTSILLEHLLHPREGFPSGASSKEPACQRRRPKRPGFDPWVGKIPWRRARPPTQTWLKWLSPDEYAGELGAVWTEAQGDLTFTCMSPARHQAT